MVVGTKRPGRASPRGRMRPLPCKVPEELYGRALMAARGRYGSLSALVRDALQLHVAGLERWAEEQAVTGALEHHPPTRARRRRA